MVSRFPEIHKAILDLIILARHYGPNFVVLVQMSITAHLYRRSVHVLKRLGLRTSDHEVSGSNPATGGILSKSKRRFIATSHSCSSFHRPDMTGYCLKGRKTLKHQRIHSSIRPCREKGIEILLPYRR